MNASGTRARCAAAIAICAGAIVASGCTYDLRSFTGDDGRDAGAEPPSGPAIVSADPIRTGSVTPGATPGQLTVVQVKNGDTLRSIARDHGIDWRQLADANHLAAPYRISAGQTLMLPAARN